MECQWISCGLAAENVYNGVTDKERLGAVAVSTEDTGGLICCDA